MDEVAHKRYLNNYFRGYEGNSESRGELYNEDLRTGDARFCGTTASMCGIESAGFEQNEEKMKNAIRMDLMLHAFIFTLSGIPMLYSGDEIGQVNDYSYHDDPEKAADSRYIHRGKFNWDLTERISDPESVQGRIFEGLKELEALRSAEKVFDADADVWTRDVGDISVLCVGRWKDGEKIYGLFNFNEADKDVWLPEEGVYHSLTDGQEIDTQEIHMMGHSFLWIKRDEG